MTRRQLYHYLRMMRQMKIARQHIQDAFAAGRCSAIEISHKVLKDSIGVVVLGDKGSPRTHHDWSVIRRLSCRAIGQSTNVASDNCLEARDKSGKEHAFTYARSKTFPFDVEKRFFAR